MRCWMRFRRSSRTGFRTGWRCLRVLLGGSHLSGDRLFGCRGVASRILRKPCGRRQTETKERQDAESVQPSGHVFRAKLWLQRQTPKVRQSAPEAKTKAQAD